MSEPAAGPRALAILTDRQVFDYLCNQQISTRTQIAEDLKISKPTASAATERLMQAGLISRLLPPLVGEGGEGRRGRAPETYGINPEYGQLLALSLESGMLRLRTTDQGGKPRFDAVQEFSPQASTAQVQEHAARMITEATAHHGAPMLGCALSYSAPVWHPSHVQVSRPLPTPVFAASDARLDEIVRELTGVQPLVDNDVNWMALAQSADFPTGNSTLLVYLGAGIGAALVIEGKVHRGINGTAGELNRWRVGDSGFLDQLAAAGLTRGDTSRLEFEKLAELFATGPEAGQETESQQRSPEEFFVQLLASVLGNLSGFLNPQALVICGPLADSVPFTQRLHAALGATVDLQSTNFVVRQLGADAALRGALRAAKSQWQDNLWANYRASGENR